MGDRNIYQLPEDLTESILPFKWIFFAGMWYFYVSMGTNKYLIVEKYEKIGLWITEKTGHIPRRHSLLEYPTDSAKKVFKPKTEEEVLSFI